MLSFGSKRTGGIVFPIQATSRQSQRPNLQLNIRTARCFTHYRDSGSKPARRKNGYKRIIPEPVRKFIDVKTGAFQTSRESREFLIANGISHDNGELYAMGNANLDEISTRFSASVNFSPRHIVHPFDLRYFSLHGHPLSSMQRTKYARKCQEEALWIQVTCFGDQAAVVRNTMKRRLKGTLQRALMRRGYDAYGHSSHRVLRGTLGIHINEVMRGANLPSDLFGEAVVDALEEHVGRKTRQKW